LQGSSYARDGLELVESKRNCVEAGIYMENLNAAANVDEDES
jgi:hypothetical protein